MTTPQQSAMRKALESEGCERLKDFYNVGPVQRAAVESFAVALTQKARKYDQTDCSTHQMGCQCAIDAALAQQEEPIAWLEYSHGTRYLHFASGKPYCAGTSRAIPLYGTPLSK